jgi:hypothetical protein
MQSGVLILRGERALNVPAFRNQQPNPVNFRYSFRTSLPERPPVFRNQEFYPAAAFVIWAVSICFVILYYG